MNNAIFITGSSGFIGSNFLNFLEENASNNFDIVRINKNNYKKYRKTNYDLIFFYHFATHYSLDEKEKSLIYEANYSYGEQLLNTLELEKFKNLIYTNSIYSLSEEYIESSYVKSKNEFSILIEKKKTNEKYNFIELFLDNTYGVKDERNKILNNIVKSMNEGTQVSINNPNKYINLIEIQELCKFLFEISNKTTDEKIILTSKYSYKLNSIIENSRKIKKGEKNIEVDKKPNNLNNPRREIKVIKINSDLENYLINNL